MGARLGAIRLARGRLSGVAPVIRHEGGKWVLRSRDGSRVLGTHDSKQGAQAQERAIHAHERNRRRIGLHRP